MVELTDGIDGDEDEPSSNGSRMANGAAALGALPRAAPGSSTCFGFALEFIDTSETNSCPSLTVCVSILIGTESENWPAECYAHY